MEKQPHILGLRIYVLNSQGEPHVIGSKDPVEIGQPGNDTDTKAINEGAMFYGRHDGVDMITLPLRDHMEIQWEQCACGSSHSSARRKTMH